MAVCGRCLICGYKFDCRLDDGTAPDEAVRWACSRGERCSRSTAWEARELGEVHEHAICVTCHDHLVDDDTIGAVALALLALVRDRVAVSRPTAKAAYPPICRRCNDRGVIETGNNDLPCDCPAGDMQLFNTAHGTETGAQIKARRR